MPFNQCSVCKEWANLPHKCPPSWLVAIVCDEKDIPDLEDYGTHYGHDVEAAAEKAAKEYDSSDNDILRAGESGSYVAWVKSSPEAVPIKCAIFGEAVPQYSARRL